MAAFNTPFNTQPKKANKKELFITLGVVGALVIGTLGYYLWPKSGQQDQGGETPPSITITSSKFKGMLKGDDICPIDSMYKFSESEISSYVLPPGASGKEDPNWNILKQGIGIYHSNSDITAKMIIDSIIPTEGNKILLMYYPSSDENTEKKFSVYPSLIGNNSISTPSEFTIPAHEGFLIFSCKDTKIWGIKDEKKLGSGISPKMANKKSGWVLLSAEENKSLADTLKPFKNKVKSVWVQNAPFEDSGFVISWSADPTYIDNLKINHPSWDYSQVVTKFEDIKTVGDYKMVWLKVGPEQDKITNDPITNLKVNLATDNKSVTLSWTAPDTTTSVNYTIALYNAADGTKISENTVNTTTFQVSDVVAGMSYRFAVDTIYPDSKKSGAVSSEIVKIPAGAEIKAVTNLVATLASDKTSISLSWNPPSTLESVKYSVATYVNESKLADTNDITATTFTIPNIGAGKSYYATVKVIYSTGTSEVVKSNTIDVPAGATIKGVTSLNAVLATDKTSVNLTWTAPTTESLLYTVTEYVDNGAKLGTQINKFSSDNSGKATKFTTPTLEAGQSYYFTVVTEYPDQSKSDEIKSNTVTISTQQEVLTPLETCNSTCYTTCVQSPAAEAYQCPMLPAIQGLQVSQKNSTSIEIAWTAPAVDPKFIKTYNVEYSTPNVNLGNSTETSRMINNLTPGTQYYFTVSAIDNNDKKGMSSTISETTGAQGPSPAAIPSAPTKPTFNYTYTHSTSLYWSQPNPDLDTSKGKYRISYKKDGCASKEPWKTKIVLALDADNKTYGYKAVLTNTMSDDISINTKYGVTISASNDGITWSPESECAEFKTTAK